MQQEGLQQSKILSEEVVFEKKRIGIKQVSFSIGERVLTNYEAAYQPLTAHKFPIDAVEIMPILKRKDGTLHLIMIANFRPPIGKFCLEFPAGVVEDDDFEANALRELKKQTGYRPQRILKIPSMYTHCDPWKSSEAGEMFVAIVDQNDPNHREAQDLETTENIRVLTFPISQDLPQKLSSFAGEHNYGILGRLWGMVLGLTAFPLVVS